MIVIPDTSVWVDHLRHKNSHLETLLNEGIVAIHPFVLGELACGHIQNRREILSLLHVLPEAALVTPVEFLHFLDIKKLAGSGAGFVDVHLLASSELMQALLWTRDKLLRRLADKLDLAYS